MYKGCTVVFAAALLASVHTAQAQIEMPADQQINDFSLSGYGEQGKKNWDLSGTTADIFTTIIKLDNVVGNLYGESENICLTADKGNFYKTDGAVQLEKNVVITTSYGAQLTTDSLRWDRKQQLVTTPDPVNIHRDNIVLEGNGARGEPNLKRVELQKDVRLAINPADEKTSRGAGIKEKITITCDGSLEIDYERNIATFRHNVKVDRIDSVIYSDVLDVFFIAGPVKPGSTVVKKMGVETVGINGTKIDRIVARGHVRVIRGENVSYSDEAVYSASDNKITLKGRPRLEVVSTEGFHASSGD